MKQLRQIEREIMEIDDLTTRQVAARGQLRQTHRSHDRFRNNRDRLQQRRDQIVHHGADVSLNKRAAVLLAIPVLLIWDIILLTITLPARFPGIAGAEALFWAPLVAVAIAILVHVTTAWGLECEARAAATMRRYRVALGIGLLILALFLGAFLVQQFADLELAKRLLPVAPWVLVAISILLPVNAGIGQAAAVYLWAPRWLEWRTARAQRRIDDAAEIVSWLDDQFIDSTGTREYPERAGEARNDHEKHNARDSDDAAQIALNQPVGEDNTLSSASRVLCAGVFLASAFFSPRTVLAGVDTCECVVCVDGTASVDEFSRTEAIDLVTESLGELIEAFQCDCITTCEFHEEPRWASYERHEVPRLPQDCQGPQRAHSVSTGFTEILDRIGQIGLARKTVAMEACSEELERARAHFASELTTLSDKLRSSLSVEEPREEVRSGIVGIIRYLLDEDNIRLVTVITDGIETAAHSIPTIEIPEQTSVLMIIAPASNKHGGLRSTSKAIEAWESSLTDVEVRTIRELNRGIWANFQRANAGLSSSMDRATPKAALRQPPPSRGAKETGLVASAPRELEETCTSLHGRTGATPQWNSTWLDLGGPMNFYKHNRLQLEIGGTARAVVVRLLAKNVDPNTPAGVVGGPTIVPDSGRVDVTLEREHLDVMQISVHGGSVLWQGAYDLGRANGFPVLRRVTWCDSTSVSLQVPPEITNLTVPSSPRLPSSS